jgi:tellurite resistance protein
MKIIIEKQTRKMMKRLKSDNGFAFFSSEIGEFFMKKGIIDT